MKLEIRAGATSRAALIEIGDDLALAAHRDAYVLVWRPTQMHRCYGNVFQEGDGLDIRVESGVVGLAARAAAEGDAATRIANVRDEQRLGGTSIDVLERDSYTWLSLDWTDGVSNIISAFVDLDRFTVLEVEYRRCPHYSATWTPWTNDSRESLLAACHLRGAVETQGWAGPVPYQVLWL